MQRKTHTNSITSKTETRKKIELPSLDSPAGTNSVISTVNYSLETASEGWRGSIATKFPCLQRESLSSDITPSLPNYLSFERRGGKGKKGEKEARAALTRSNSARKHRRNHLLHRPLCLFNSVGRRRFVCARHAVIRNFNRAYTHTQTHTHILLSGLASFDNPFISALLVSSRPLLSSSPIFFPLAREISPRLGRQSALLKCRETVSGGRPRNWL